MARRILRLYSLTEDEEEKMAREFLELGLDDGSMDLSDSDATIYSGESDFGCDEISSNTDSRSIESRNSTLDEECDVEMSVTESQNLIKIPIEPNRGQKYLGQGKNDKTIWWSMPNETQKLRTENMKKIEQSHWIVPQYLLLKKKMLFNRFFRVQLLN